MEEVKVTNTINFDLEGLTLQELEAFKIFKLKLLKAIYKNIRKREVDVYKIVSDYFKGTSFIESESYVIVDMLNYYIDSDTKVKFDYEYNSLKCNVKYKITIENNGYKINIIQNLESYKYKI